VILIANLSIAGDQDPNITKCDVLDQNMWSY